MPQLETTPSPLMTQPASACRALERHAQERIPGLSQLLSKRPDRFSQGVWPTYYDRAKGAEVWDLDENRYIDMSIGGIGANVLGYANDVVDDAVKAAIDKGSSSSLNCPEDVALADELCRLHPWAEKVRFARCGGEAMAVGVRIARTYTQRDVVAFCGYHGWHDWYLAANIGTEDALGEHLLKGLEPRGVPKALKGTSRPFRYNHLEELERIVSETGKDLAAIVMEPIRSEQPVAGFLEGVRALADESGAVLIVDEVSAGFRLNAGGAHLVLGLEPDIAVFSKAMGNGYPIAAIIGKGKAMDAAQASFISSTMWSERTGPTAALATIRFFEEHRVNEHLVAIGSAVQAGWKKQSAKHDVAISVGGIAPLSHFAFQDKDALALKALFVQELLDRGFLASTSFYSMWSHTEQHVTSYVHAVGEVFATIREAVEKGDVRARLLGEPAASGFARLA